MYKYIDRHTKNQGLETSEGLNNCTTFEVNVEHWPSIPLPTYSKKY